MSEEPTDLGETRTVAQRAASRSSSAPLPDHIGKFRILSKLGEGGMGVVFEAQQTAPRRRVAVKVVRGGTVVDDHRLRMFQREADTLARLEHPNIAAIYESGRTEGGEHFFAMELVHGETLDAFLKRRVAPLDRQEIAFRLRMFLKLCRAVHYAHQRGVIHRDLKPANVIVVNEPSGPGEPELKVLDFGLARITDADVAATMVSEIGVIKGTLPYMSPEQSRGNPAEIDIRSDVYAMGVILFEMLTGNRPIDVRNDSIVDAIQAICERPPARLRDSWTGSTRPDGDLETIVGKALEKSADRRYAGAAAFAEDVERFLASQPILARPPSGGYLLRKFARRNKILVSGIVATFLALLAGIVVSTAQRRQAEAARDDLARVVEFKAGMIGSQQPERTGDRILQEILERIRVGERAAGSSEQSIRERIGAVHGAMERVNLTDLARSVIDRNILEIAADSAKAEFAEAPEIEATLLHALSSSYAELGMPDRAVPHLERALRLRDSALGPDHAGTLATLAKLCQVLTRAGEYQAAEPHLTTLVARSRESRGPTHAATLQAESFLAGVRWELGQSDDAEQVYLAALDKQRRILGDDDMATLGSMHDLGVIYFRQGRYPEAERIWSEALEGFRGRADHDPDDLLALDIAAGLAVLYGETGERERARPMLEDLLEREQRVHGSEHPRTVKTRTSLATIYSQIGETEAGIRLQRETLRIRERDLGIHHPLTLRSMNNLAYALTSAGQHEDAGEMLRRLVVLDRAVQPDSADHGVHLHTLAEVEIALGRLADADRALLEALVIYRKTQHRYTGLALFQLAQVAAQVGRGDAAIDYLREAVEHGHRQGLSADAAEFESIRERPDFRQLLKRASENG